VAIRAEPRRHCVRAGQLETGGRVIESGVRPQHCVVAGLASRRERCGDVVHRRGCVVVIRLVARDTSCRRQVVIVVDVAIGASARRHGVGAAQREAGSVVIKRCVQPGAGAVTLIAGLREVRRDVIRIRRALIVLEVAADAGRSGQVVIVVNVAISALARRNRVKSSQRESRGVVIERRVHPVRCVMTLVTGLREVRRHVVRVRRALIVLQVAADAGRGIDAVVVIDVAIGAGTRRNDMHSGKREARGCVVECSTCPVAGAVTLIARLREVRRDVIGIGSGLIVL